MDNQVEQVYVALGNDLQDGYKTLEWTLKKWNSQPISIIILHVAFNVSKDFVYTPCKISYAFYLCIDNSSVQFHFFDQIIQMGSSKLIFLYYYYYYLFVSMFFSWEAACKCC